MRWVLLGLLLASASAGAEEFYGPLRIRDMSPFQILRLNMLPDHAIAPRRGRFGLELHLSHSNTFVADDDVLAYLAERGRRAEISRDDFEAIRGRADDAFLFDAAIGYFLATAHYGFSDRWSGYVSLPAHYFGGGFMDSTIEHFHEQFGFDTFGREFISRNDFQALAIIDGESFFLPERPTHGGAGDPVFGIRYYHPLLAHSAFTIEFAHKATVQDPAKFRSTGSSDTGLQVSWHAHGQSNSIYVSAAVVHTGRSEPFPDRTRRISPSLNVAWEARVGRSSNLVAQINAARSLFDEGADAELAADVYQASLGFRQRYGEFVWSYALTENLVNFNNSADLGFHVGFAWLPQLPRTAAR